MIARKSTEFGHVHAMGNRCCVWLFWFRSKRRHRQRLDIPGSWPSHHDPKDRWGGAITVPRIDGEERPCFNQRAASPELMKYKWCISAGVLNTTDSM